jgi:hypothetical protein
MDGQDQEYTRGERAAGVFGLLLFLGLALIAADLASGGKVFRRGGCGCPDQAAEAAAGDG